MTAREFRRWLARQGCTFESHKGGGGHLTVIRGQRRSQLPMCMVVARNWARVSSTRSSKIWDSIRLFCEGPSMYTIILTPDDNGTILVTCTDLPELATFGEDVKDAMHQAADAIEEALIARISRWEEIPASSAGLGERNSARLPPLTVAKVELYGRYMPKGVKGGTGAPHGLAQAADRPAFRPQSPLGDRAHRSRAARDRQISRGQRPRRGVTMEPCSAATASARTRPCARPSSAPIRDRSPAAICSQREG
jgi:predicted RNase H-like HicB family nuclease